MPKFTDNDKRTWPVEMNITTVKRVRKLLDVDLLAIYEGGSFLARLATDPVLLVDVLYAICKPEADALTVEEVIDGTRRIRRYTDEDFGRAMAGDAIDGGTKALMEALALFHRSPEGRANFGRIAEATDQAMRRVEQEIKQKLDRELQGIVDQAVAQALSGDLSTSAPGSSA